MAMTSGTNPYGDIELDVTGMRALAHPVRLRLLSALQRHGPNTATALSERVGASPSVVSWHLRHLAKHGLVRDAAPPDHGARDGRERWWEAVARGIRLMARDEDEGQIAYRALSRVMLDEAHDLPLEWYDDVEPLLEPGWRELAGLANTRILATDAELAAIEGAMQEILAPYVLRKDGGPVPSGARGVRVMRYVLPELAEEPV